MSDYLLYLYTSVLFFLMLLAYLISRKASTNRAVKRRQLDGGSLFHHSKGAFCLIFNVLLSDRGGGGVNLLV